MDKEFKTPLALITVASDLLMVSDSHSHSIYQVCIDNNGAFLKGTVSLLMKLPEGAQPMGLAFDGNIVYVADSSSNGGITKFNSSTSESQVIVRNMWDTILPYLSWVECVLGWERCLHRPDISCGLTLFTGKLRYPSDCQIWCRQVTRWFQLSSLLFSANNTVH